MPWLDDTMHDNRQRQGSKEAEDAAGGDIVFKFYLRYFDLVERKVSELVVISNHI